MIAMFPGSFETWHDGHQSVLEQALLVFDKVVVAIGDNPSKPGDMDARARQLEKDLNNDDVHVIVYKGLLVQAAERYEADVIIRGLRNSADFEYEKNLQYWNEDLGLILPIFYVISDRSLVHMSSSAQLMVNKFTK